MCGSTTARFCRGSESGLEREPPLAWTSSFHKIASLSDVGCFSSPSRGRQTALDEKPLKSGAEEVVDAEGILGLVAPSPPSSDFLPYNYLASGQLSATKSLLLPSTGRYLVLGTSAPPDPGKRRAEFKMKSSSEVT